MPPAARITDLHTCPAHAGGPIVTGFPTVLIGHKPAARVTDKALCAGPVDTIVTGSSNVIIGYQEAARMGDKTMHGAVIATGFPTVIIGTTPQATALAGAGGVPFCEECERARRIAQERAELDAKEKELSEQQGDDAGEDAGADQEDEADTPASADEPTEGETKQASAPGNTPEQRAAREKVVRDFYEKSGLGSARADVDLGVSGLPPRPNLHLKGFGIDLSKPLSVVQLPEMLSQVVPKGALPGNVFDPRGTPLGDALGLGALPSVDSLKTFFIPPGMGLLSTSGPGAGRIPGVPQITVPDAVLRLVT
ncbi:Hypothetical protein A7982_05046 [Minicystis rosea]|nr:Hypothetical protein A7982_05046 [Minicystis rosea]